MVVGINIKSNIREFTRSLNKVQRQQIPYATSRTLNTVAFDVRAYFIEHTWPTAFPGAKRKNFARGVLRVKKSHKANLVAEVYDQRGLDYLTLHERGGTKTPRGRHIAIPREVRRTSRGISPAKRPRAVLQSGHAFIVRGPAGPLVVERKGKKTKLLYALIPRAHIRPTLKIQEDGTTVVRRQLSRTFGRELGRALATARL